MPRQLNKRVAFMHVSANLAAKFERVEALNRAFNAGDFDAISAFLAPHVRSLRPEMADEAHPRPFRTLSCAHYLEQLRTIRQRGPMEIVGISRSCDLIVAEMINMATGARIQTTFHFNAADLIEIIFSRPAGKLASAA